MTAQTARQLESPYQSASLRDGAGEPLRPGGRRLTERALGLGAWHCGERVIEVGCGRGIALKILGCAGVDAIGVDLSAEALLAARDAQLAVVRANGDALPFADESADGVLAECSFSLMPDQPAALKEFHRVLRPGGRLVICDVYARNPPAEGNAPVPCLEGVLVRQSTERLLARSGLPAARWEDHSDVLKAFVARFLFEYGSLEALWSGASCLKGGSGAAAKALGLGYAILVARKPSALDAQERSNHG
jgi:ubiquinone/menaquinone biosynthesis C-methylase UbiE